MFRLLVSILLLPLSADSQPPKPGAEPHRCASVCWIAFDASGSRFVCSNQDNEIVLWGRDGGKPTTINLEKREGASQSHSFPWAGAVDGEGRHALVQYLDGTTQVYSLPEGRKLRDLECPIRSPYGARLSTDGRMIASRGVLKNSVTENGRHNAIVVWNLSDWSTAAVIEAGFDVGDIEFSSDSHEILAAGSVRTSKPGRGYEGVVVSWRIDGGQETARLVYEGEGLPTRVAASPDGRTIAVAASLRKSGDPRVHTATSHLRLIDWKAKKTLTEPFLQNWDTIRTLAFSPDGERVYCGAETIDAARNLHTHLVCHSAPGGKLEWKTKLEGANPHMIAMSPDGRTVLTSAFRSIEVVDAATGVHLGMKVEAIAMPPEAAVPKRKRQ